MAADVVEPKDRNPDCDSCKRLVQNAQTICLPGSGPEDADLMVVGEAPGQSEDEQGEPFVGKVGKFQRKQLFAPAGINPENVRLENAVRCRPPGNANPTIKEIQNCRPYLWGAARKTNPKVILVAGNAPLASLLFFDLKSKKNVEGGKDDNSSKSSGITKWRGRQIWHPYLRCWIVPTVHPSFTNRQYNAGSDYYLDKAIEEYKLASYLAGKPRPDYQWPTTETVVEPERAREVIQEMWDAGTFGFDIETGGSGRPIDKWIIGCSFASTENQGYYIPWGVIEEVRSDFDRLVTSKDHQKLMHNGTYEVNVFRHNGHPIHDRYFDTMIAAGLVDENFEKGLKPLSWLYTHFGGYEIPLDRYKQRNGIEEDYSLIPLDTLGPYAALDAVATVCLYNRFRPQMKREKSFPLFNKISMPVRRVMTNAEYNGIRVDPEWVNRLDETCKRANELLTSKVHEAAGEEFNLNSTPQLQRILFRKMGFEPLKKTKTGYSTDADTIEYIASQVREGEPGWELAQALLSRNYLKTMHKTHVMQARDWMWPEDGRVHTNYNMTGTVTGRTSCAKPGLHNVPNDRLVRSMYLASEGCLLVEEDLKSAELAYLAAESGEETLIRAFNEGRDPHSDTYRRLYDLPESYQPTKEERRFSKVINFGVVYGMTSYGLASRLGITEEEAEDFLSQYFSRLPAVQRYMERTAELITEQGYVKSLFHRRRRIPDGMSDLPWEVGRAQRQAMNAPIQSGAADYTYTGLVRLDRNIRRMGLNAVIVHTVHDCGIEDTPIDEVERMKEAVTDAFETPLQVVPVRMQVETEVHKRWGETNESKLAKIFDSVGLHFEEPELEHVG